MYNECLEGYFLGTRTSYQLARDWLRINITNWVMYEVKHAKCMLTGNH